MAESEMIEKPESILSKTLKTGITIVLAGVALDLYNAGIGMMREFRLNSVAEGEEKELRKWEALIPRIDMRREIGKCLTDYDVCKSEAKSKSGGLNNFCQAATTYPPHYAQCAENKVNCLHMLEEGAVSY